MVRVTALIYVLTQEKSSCQRAKWVEEKIEVIWDNMQEMSSVKFNTDTLQLMRSFKCNAGESQKKMRMRDDELNAKKIL